jgi:hypothetical protein
LFLLVFNLTTSVKLIIQVRDVKTIEMMRAGEEGRVRGRFTVVTE